MARLVKTLLAGLALGVMGQGTAAYAQDEAAPGGADFRRDRNLSVQQRVPEAYRSLGVKWGGFTAWPRVQVDLESTDNVFYAPTNKQSDFIVRVRPELAVRSNWSRHRLGALARVGASYYADHNDESNTEWLLNASGRYDIVGATNLFGGLTINQGYDQRGEEPSLITAVEPVKYQARSGDLGVDVVGNRLRVIGKTSFQTFDYDDVRSFGGTIIDQDHRDRTEVRGLVRGEYAISPDTSVYLYYEANKREYDQFGALRDSDGYDAGIGASFDLSRLVRGEVQVGQYKQSYKNSGYSDAKGSSYRGKVEWFPTQLTTVGFHGSRAVYETPEIGSSGYVSSVLGVSVDHELRRNIVLSAAYSRADNDYNQFDREDERARVDLAVRYRMNRKVAIVGGYTYSDLSSSGTQQVPSYKNNTVKLSFTLAY